MRPWAMRGRGAGCPGVVFAMSRALRGETRGLNGRVCARLGHSEGSVGYRQKHEKSADHFARDHASTYAGTE